MLKNPYFKGYFEFYLSDNGFFSALGTYEHPGMTGEILVKRGVPNTYDYNNGITAIYDEMGRPWIIRNYDGQVRGGMGRIDLEYRITRGAHVPHSNDGGYFIREVLPKL